MAGINSVTSHFFWIANLWPIFLAQLFEGPSASLTKEDVGKLEAVTYPRRQVLPNESGTLGFQQV